MTLGFAGGGASNYDETRDHYWCRSGRIGGRIVAGQGRRARHNPGTVVLTGSGATGTAVLRDLAQDVIPAVCELSGCDAVFVRRDADLDIVASALRFGLQFNGSETCIAPRRVFVHRTFLPELERRLGRVVTDCAYRPLPAHLAALVTQAVAAGARVIIGHPQQHAGYAPLA